MQCPFCKHEVAKGVTECPYCHYQFAVDAEVLSSDERDSFDGLTIEEDGSTTSGQNATYEESGSFQEEERPTHFGQREENEEPQTPGGFQVQTFGVTGCLIGLLIILFMLIFFFVAAVKMIVAFPLLGALALVWWLNGTYHWFQG